MYIYVIKYLSNVVVHIRVVLLPQSLKGVVSIKSSFTENLHNAIFIFDKIYEIKIL